MVVGGETNVSLRHHRRGLPTWPKARQCCAVIAGRMMMMADSPTLTYTRRQLDHARRRALVAKLTDRGFTVADISRCTGWPQLTVELLLADARPTV